MTTATTSRTGNAVPSTAPSTAPGTSPAARPTVASLHPHPKPGRLGPVRVQQLVLIEVAAALVLIAWAGNHLLLAPCGAIAAVLVVLAVFRRHRGTLPEYLASAYALRRRQRMAAAEPASVWTDPSTDPGLIPAIECDPALRTYSYTRPERDHHRSVGMVGDGTFLTAVLLVQANDEPLRPRRATRPLPFNLLHDALEVDGIILDAIQVVQHTLPAPAPHLPEHAVAVRAYQPVQAQTGTPGLRLTWVALRLDPELCPEAVQARGGGLGGAQRSLLRAADQLASRLEGAGFTATVLEETELVSAIATAACVNPLANANNRGGHGGAHRRTVESARAWRCDDRWHTTYWVGRWPQLMAVPSAGSAPELVNKLTSTPTLATTISLTVRRGTGGAPAITGYLRICARSDRELVTVRRQLERRASNAKLALVRLDREQVPGVLATLPLGGTR